MIPVSAEVAAAIVSPDRRLRARVNIDWLHDGHGSAGSLDDLSSYVDGFRRTQTWQTDLPDQVRIADGSSVASLTASVARGDVLGRQSTVTYQGAGSTANSASPAPVYGLLTAPAGATTGSLILIGVTVADLTVTVNAITDMESLGAITYGTGSSGFRLWLFQHRLRPTTDPYDSLSLDVDVSFVFSNGDTVPYSVAAVAFDGNVRAVDVFNLSRETVTGTSHTTGQVTVPDGTVLVGFWSWLTGTTGTWTPPAGDTERVDVRGTHATTNLALAVTTSPTLPAGTYTRTATTSASTGAVLMGLIAVSPFPATDERNHAAHWLSPDNRDSPLHPIRRVRRHTQAGIEILTATNGWQEVRRFTGYTRNVAANAGSRTGQIEALDNRELMRGQIDVPPILGDRAGLNASWLVSLACYAAGIPASPPATVTSTRVEQVWMPMHGSLRAMHGAGVNGAILGLQYDDAYAINAIYNKSRPTFIEGPWLLGAYAYHASDGDFLAVVSQPWRYYFVDLVGASGSRQGRLEMQVRGDSLGASLRKEACYVRFDDELDFNLFTYVGVAFDRRLTVRIEDGGVDVIRVFGPTVPADGLWHAVGISWDFDAGTKVISWYLDGATSTTNPVFTATYAGENEQYYFASYLPVAEVHISQCGTSEPWLWASPFTPEAAIDKSLLELSAAAYRGRVELWQLVSDLAAAEQAVATFDEQGVFRYRTRARLTQGSGQSVQVVLADDRNVTDLSVVTRIDAVRNVIEVPYVQPRADAGRPEEVWLWTHSGTPIKVPWGGQATTVTIPFSDVPWAVDTLIDPLAVAPPLPQSYMIFNASEDGNGPDITDGLIVAISSWTTSGCEAIVFNSSGQDVWIIEGAVGGYRFNFDADGTVEVRDDISRKRYGDQPMKVDSSPWIQSADVATALGGLIVADLKEPRAVIDSLRIVGDPRLQVGDRVEVVGRQGLAMDREFWLTKVDESLDSGRYVMTCTAREASEVVVLGTTRLGEGVVG